MPGWILMGETSICAGAQGHRGHSSSTLTVVWFFFLSNSQPWEKGKSGHWKKGPSIFLPYQPAQAETNHVTYPLHGPSMPVSPAPGALLAQGHFFPTWLLLSADMFP